jgi:hypothetical protein
LQTVNPRYRIWAVLAFLKVALLVINIQAGVFGILATYDVIPANRVLTNENRAIREWTCASGHRRMCPEWNNMMVCAEMLLMSAASTFVFRPSVCDLFVNADAAATERQSLLDNCENYGTSHTPSSSTNCQHINNYGDLVESTNTQQDNDLTSTSTRLPK